LVALDLPETIVPPGSILCVRSLVGPVPGGLKPERRSGCSKAPWPRAWCDRLESIARRASRPTRGRLPSNTEAVLFADEAELLACLAVAALSGRPAREWWWASPLRPEEAADWTLRWLRRPHLMPAAVERTARD